MMTVKSAAEKVLQRVRGPYLKPHVIHEVNERDFPHLALDFYEKTQRVFEENGFRWLGDIEDETIRETSPDPRAFIRIMASPDGRTTAGFYHLKPKLFWRLLLFLYRFPTRVLEFQSLLSDGSQLITSCAKEDAQLPPPPQLNRLFRSPRTPIDRLIAFHEENLRAAEKSRNCTTTKINTIMEAIEVEKKQLEIQGKYLESIGWVTEEYLAKQTGGNRQLAGEIIKEIQRILREEKESQR